MITTVQIGPFSLPLALLLCFTAIGLALFVGNRIAARHGQSVEARLHRAVLVAVVAARLAFVAQHLDSYLASPLAVLTLLDIRDGGWTPWAGLLAAWGYVALSIRFAGAPRKPLLAALLTGSAVWLAGTALLALPERNGPPLPAITLLDLADRPALLSRHTGHPTVVNLWASWCPPCRREMPAFEQAQRKYPEVNFVFVNQGESAAQIQRFLQDQGLALDNVLRDPDAEVARLFRQRGLPATLFFDADGTLVDIRVGELSHATLAQRLATLTPRRAEQVR